MNRTDDHDVTNTVTWYGPSMPWSEWIPAISSSTVVGAACAVLGYYVRTSIEKNIQFNFDQKLEELRAHLRKDEERLKAAFNARDEQISALRNGALAGATNRQELLDKRRLEAAENVWAAAVELSSLKGYVHIIFAISTDEAIRVAGQKNSQGARIREFADGLWKNANGFVIQRSPDNDRPFIKPIVWAIFSAYRHSLLYPSIQLSVLRTGALKELLDPSLLLNTLKSTLPHRSDYIDQHGAKALVHLIDELEELLLKTVTESLVDSTSSDESIQQAAKILSAVEEASQQIPQSVRIPDIERLAPK